MLCSENDKEQAVGDVNEKHPLLNRVIFKGVELHLSHFFSLPVEN